MSEIVTALDEVLTARRYVQDLLRNIETAQWYRRPSDGVTHVAWQVGHLAVAQYGLALKRVRGEQPEDEALISAEFRKQFGKGSVPASDAAAGPGVDEIRTVFERVHRQVCDELQSLPEATFSEPVAPPPHPMFRTKLGAVRWCAQHEFIHAGQIALLRRLLGQAPLR